MWKQGPVDEGAVEGKEYKEEGEEREDEKGKGGGRRWRMVVAARLCLFIG